MIALNNVVKILRIKLLGRSISAASLRNDSSVSTEQGSEAPKALAMKLPVYRNGKQYKLGDLYQVEDLKQVNSWDAHPGTLSNTRMDAFNAMKCNPLDFYKDSATLSNFVTETGMIMHRKHTNLCAKNQRKLTKAIKRARAMGLLPYTYKLRTTKENIGSFMNFMHD